MSPYLAYVLGVFTVLVPIMIFYILSINFPYVSTVYDSVFCNSV